MPYINIRNSFEKEILSCKDFFSDFVNMGVARRGNSSLDRSV